MKQWSSNKNITFITLFRVSVYKPTGFGKTTPSWQVSPQTRVPPSHDLQGARRQGKAAGEAPRAPEPGVRLRTAVRPPASGTASLPTIYRMGTLFLRTVFTVMKLHQLSPYRLRNRLLNSNVKNSKEQRRRQSGHLAVPVDELPEVLVLPQHRLGDQVLVGDADGRHGGSTRRVRQPRDLRGLLVVFVLQIQLCIKRRNFSICVSR